MRKPTMVNLVKSIACLPFILTVSGVICDNRCDPGFYGKGCDKRCNDKCRSYTTGNIYCEKHSGTCLLGCAPGWYNEKCNIPCSKNCINDVCNQQTGQCAIGCKGNYTGAMCDVYKVSGVICDNRCDPGLYGEGCDKRCNDKCRSHSNGNIYCEKHSGTCLLGCVPGWYNGKCTVPCSKNCISDVCHQQTGQCTNGCKGNYRGAMCDLYKVDPLQVPEIAKDKRFWIAYSTVFSIFLVVIIICKVGPRLRKHCNANSCGSNARSHDADEGSQTQPFNKKERESV